MKLLMLMLLAGAACLSTAAYSANNKDDLSLLTKLQEDAKKGDADAQFSLGLVYRYGRHHNHPRSLDFWRSDELALEWQRKAAAQHHIGARYELDRMYEEGRVAPIDEQAPKGYKRAAQAGFAPAQYNLGMIYERGLGGVQRDAGKAVEWYRRAVVQGDTDADSKLYVMYASGRVPQTDDAAVAGYKHAAQEGSAVAQYTLGVLYETGSGAVQRDAKEAARWYKKAANQQHPLAQAGIERARNLKKNNSSTHRKPKRKRGSSAEPTERQVSKSATRRIQRNAKARIRKTR